MNLEETLALLLARVEDDADRYIGSVRSVAAMGYRTSAPYLRENVEAALDAARQVMLAALHEAVNVATVILADD